MYRQAPSKQAAGLLPFTINKERGPWKSETEPGGLHGVPEGKSRVAWAEAGAGAGENAGAGIPAGQTKVQSQEPNQTSTAQERSTPGDSPGTPAGQTRPLHVFQLKYNRGTLLCAEY